MATTPRLTITIAGQPFAYCEWGSADAPVILALHGWGASADLIAPLGTALASRGFRVIAPDLPGFGETPPPHSAWSVHDYTNHVVLFLDTLKLEQVMLFGHSFGGRLSLLLGAQHEARVRKMALADSAGVLPRRSLQSRLRLGAYKAVRDGLSRVGLKALSDQLRTWYVKRYGSADYQQAGVLRESFVKIVNEDLLPYAAQIRVPTLLIWGGRDEDTPLWQAKKLEAAIPDAGLVVYDDAGHYSYLDRLPDVVRTLEYFYKQA